PSTVGGFATGVGLSGPVKLRNLLISRADYAVQASGNAVELNYCTVADCLQGVYGAGPGTAIYNSIISASVQTFADGSAQCRGVAYSDLWPLANSVAPWCNGGQVASFDPGFHGTGADP